MPVRAASCSVSRWADDPTPTDAQGRNALHLACASKQANVDTVRILLALNIDREARMHDGRSAVDVAAAGGRWDLVAAIDPSVPRPTTMDAGELHEDLIKILGRLKYRTSYGQNVLKHTLEVVHLAGLMATELDANVKTTKRAAMLHDVGKAVTHEIEGSHAQISTQYAKRYGEAPGVVHAIEAHHYEVQPQTVEAVLLIAADAISGARPGARGDSLENYIKRLEALEELAAKKEGVEKVYALQAGREIRVIVKPAEIDDDQAALLSHESARDIEQELEYPGQIKVTVIRESRSTEFAK